MRITSLILVLAFALSAHAQSDGANDAYRIAPPADASERVKDIFVMFDHSDTPGCVVGVSSAGAVILRGAWGMADLEHKVPLTPDTILEAGSVSKQFTEAAVLLLAEEGKLSLNDSVRKYIPELPDYGTPITVEQLVHHTNGLRDWSSGTDVQGWARTTREYSNAWVLDIASHQKHLNYTPGDDWSYTNTGYNLLAILVQRVSGESLAQFTHDTIFIPLGMQSTSWRDDFQRIVPNRAIAYEMSGGVQHQLMPFENAYGNGGLLTTVGDLLRWNDRFAGHGVGRSSFLNDELEPGRLTDGRVSPYGAGLYLLDHDGAREISHSGNTAGYTAWLGFYPDRQLSVAVLCNSAEANPLRLGRKVSDVFLPVPAARTAKSDDSAFPAGLTGLYENRRDHTTISIEGQDGKLIANGTSPLVHVSATTFKLAPGGNSLFEIETDAGGNPVGLGLQVYGFKFATFDRVERATPTEAEMMAMTGTYVSDEAETEFKVVSTSQGLEIHQRPDLIYSLRPTYHDGFDSKLGSVRFLRDHRGQIIGLSLGDSRMWDLRFRRVDGK